MNTSLEQPVVRSGSGRIPETRHFCTPVTDYGEAASGELHDVWCSDKSLDLCRKDLTCLRCDMPRCIEHLYLEGNLLQELPGELFDHLPQLVWLDLRKNRLQKLPARIGTHRCLRTLLLETNPLIELPIELGNVLSLKALNLRNCPLQFPPLDIVHLGTKIILSFLRQHATQFISETQNQEMDPIHPIKMVKQTLKIIKIKNSLGNCFEQQSEKKLQKAMEPLMSVRGHMFCCKSPPKPVLCSKMNIIRNNVLQRSDRKQVFEVKANVKDPNDTLHQRKKVTGKMFPVLSKLMEDQNCPEKMQRKKKELKKPNIKSDKKDFEQLPLVNIQQKNEDKLKSGMEVNIQKRSDEETVKELKICKTKDVELKLQHRIQQYQQLRKKRRRPRKAVSPEDANAEVENLRKSLSRLKMERQSPMEYRLCAFIGEYSS